MKPLHTLTGHTGAVSYVAWSPDDFMLLTSGVDFLVKLWDTMTGICVKTISKHASAVTAVAWFPDNVTFVSGGGDKFIYMWDVNGNELHSWNVAPISDLTITSDARYMIVTCQEKKVRIFDLENKTEEFMQETDTIASLELSKDNKQILVNVSANEIHAWDLESKRIIQKYRGQKHQRYVIRSCFGGANQAFVSAGSEDSQVYIWHRAQGTLLFVLPGHSGTVNAVAWNPTNHKMLASCSDDHTIRIWC